MSEKDRLAGLADIAGMFRDKDLAALSQAVAKCQRISEQIEEIDAQLQRRAVERAGLALPDAAMRAGSDERWVRLLETRREDLNIALAVAAAEREAARTVATRALGRADAFDRLSSRRSARQRV